MVANRVSESSTTEISRPNSSQGQTKEINKEHNYSRPLSTITSIPATPDTAPPTKHKDHESVIEVTTRPQVTKEKSTKQRWSLFSRKSMVVAAH